MNDYTYTSKINRSGAQEIAMRARKIEKQQALLRAELTKEVHPEKKNRRSLLDAIVALSVLIFGAPRHF